MRKCTRPSLLYCTASDEKLGVGLGTRLAIGCNCVSSPIKLVHIQDLKTIVCICCPIQMETKVVLSKLVQNFTISLPDNYKLVAAARTTIQPKDNVPCTLESRFRSVNNNY